MTEIQITASIVLVLSGIYFMFIGSLGVLRMPDFYSRTHAVSTSDSLGILLVIIGLIIYEGATINSLKLSLIVLFVALSNPIGTHALARAAYKSGVKPLLNGPDIKNSRDA